MKCESKKGNRKLKKTGRKRYGKEGETGKRESVGGTARDGRGRRRLMEKNMR